jgi:hypothetical protein
MQITTQDFTGKVIVYPLGNAKPAEGWTIRDVELIPSGQGGLKWDYQENTLVRIPIPLMVPSELPTWRVRSICKLTAFGETNLGHAIEAIIATLDIPEKIVADQIWNRGNMIARDSQILQFICQQLELSDEFIDSLFIQASQLPT